MKLNIKLLIIGELVLLVLTCVLLFPVRQMMRDQIVEDMQRELSAIASTAALHIDGDLHKQVRGPGDIDSAAFDQLRNQLIAIRNANNLTVDNLYTFYRDGETLRFGVMTQTPFVGDAYELRPHIEQTFDTGQTVATDLYEDANGRWIAATAPIRDSSGSIVGVLEVNRPSEAYFARFDAITLLTTVIAVVSLGIGSMLGWLVLDRLIISPMRAIHDGMKALGRQDFTHRVHIRTRDEFQQLSETMNTLLEQFNVARSIQQGFFPRELPHGERYRFAAASEPCDATGGDYVDTIAVSEAQTLVLVADVTGHGIGPSLLMASCRSALHALSTTGLEPAQMLEKLEDLLDSDLQEGRFITMIVGLLDTGGGFTFANAGHGPALLLQGEQVTRLETHRPPLGVRIDMNGHPPQSRVQLASGDRVLLASDGLNESQSPDNEQFGTHRIEAIVRDRTLDCDAVVGSLLKALRVHRCDRPAIDDVTILCVDHL